MNFITSPSQTTPKRLNPLRLHTSLPTLSPTEQGKRIAAYAAVDANVSLDSRVIGIGSGSTVPYVIERIVQQGEANVQRVFIPTGFQSKQLIVQNDLVLGDVDQYPAIDVTLDGADEVDGNLNALKGGGACHLREKVLAEAANIFVIVADERKNSKLLGTTWTQGVPIEVAPFAYAKVLQNVQKLGAMRPTLRMGVRKAGPVVTDNANFVIDAPFSESYYRDPKELLMRIKMLTGVVEVGLFCGMAKAAYFGYSNGSVLIRSADGTVCEQASTRETTHNVYPRALEKDRHESRNGLQNVTKKQGAGPHAWGTYDEEINHYELGVKDTLVGLRMRNPHAAENSDTRHQRRTSNVSVEDRDNARKERLSLGNDITDLSAIARSSAAGSVNANANGDALVDAHVE